MDEIYEKKISKKGAENLRFKKLFKKMIEKNFPMIVFSHLIKR